MNCPLVVRVMLLHCGVTRAAVYKISVTDGTAPPAARPHPPGPGLFAARLAPARVGGTPLSLYRKNELETTGPRHATHAALRSVVTSTQDDTHTVTSVNPMNVQPDVQVGCMIVLLVRVRVLQCSHGLLPSLFPPHQSRGGGLMDGGGGRAHARASVGGGGAGGSSQGGNLVGSRNFSRSVPLR